jgi:hypothetical protein
MKNKSSAIKRGNADKKKTRDWYRAQGYASEYTELLRTIFAGPGKLFYQKNDLFASDGIAMGYEKIIFWNSKGRSSLEKSTLGSALRKFDEFPFPPYVIREVVMWELRKKNPYRLRKQGDRIWSIDSNGAIKEYEYRNINLVEKLL